MIEGLKFDWKAEDLKAHLLKRLAHHKERAAFYAKERDNFAKNAQDAEIRHGQCSFTQTKEAMDHACKDHEKSVSLFEFMAAHVVKGQTYRLTPNELGMAEA